MKKVFQITMFLAIAAMAFVSCEKDDEKFDPRDQFVGSYTSTVIGRLTFTVDGENASEPINTTDAFTIKKANNADKVFVLSSGGAISECIVSGNTLSYTNPHVESGNGFVLTGTRTGNGTISGNILTLTYKTTGLISGSVSGTFSMNVTEIATKK